MVPGYVAEGQVTQDWLLNGDVECELCPDGVAFRRQGGSRHFVHTKERPGAGLKVTTLDPLTPLLEDSIAAGMTLGGGALHLSLGLARLLRDCPARPEVVLINSGGHSPELDALCAQSGVRCCSLARQSTPRSLIVPLSNRLILKEGAAPCPPNLEDGQRQVVGGNLAHAGVLASVSPKDAALSAGATAMCNGARRYLQPPGALPPELSLLLLTTAHEVICNLAEWLQVGRWAGVAAPDVTEDSADAPEAAAKLLRTLNARRLAGARAAVATLGRRGCLVMDWRLGQGYHLALEITDGSGGVPTPAGAGDRWLAAWIYFRQTWSIEGQLKDPLAANALRATHTVAGQLGLRRDRYDVRVRPI